MDEAEYDSQMVFMLKQISNESRNRLLSNILGKNHLNPLSDKDIASFITAAESLLDVNFSFDVFETLDQIYDKKPDLLKRDLIVGRDIEKIFIYELTAKPENYSRSTLLGMKTLNNILDKYSRSKDYLVQTGVDFLSNQPKYSFR